MRRLIGALSGAVLVSLMAANLVFGFHAIGSDNVAPNANSHWEVDGNPRCGAAPDGGFNKKIEGEDLGVGNYGPIRITAYDGKHVSWKIRDAYLHTYDANLVIVKGGPTAMYYSYDTNDDWDTDPTAPRNPNGAGPKYYGISHISFCFDPKA